MNEMGTPMGLPSRADQASVVCPKCAIDEVHIALVDGYDPQPAASWPVTTWHPMTVHIQQVMDEEIDRVASRRSA